MLTFNHLKGSSVKCAGGSMPIVSFPEKTVDGAINLMNSPQEFPSREMLSWPGEYDIGGISVRGIGHQEGQRISYVADVEGMRVAFPCSPLEEWEEIDIEHLGDVHVMVLPSDDVKKCQKLIDEVDPRVLILVPGADGSIHPDILKACGAADKERSKEFKLKGSLPQEGREVVVFG